MYKNDEAWNCNATSKSEVVGKTFLRDMEIAAHAVSVRTTMHTLLKVLNFLRSRLRDEHNASFYRYVMTGLLQSTAKILFLGHIAILRHIFYLIIRKLMRSATDLSHSGVAATPYIAACDTAARRLWQPPAPRLARAPLPPPTKCLVEASQHDIPTASLHRLL